MQGKPLRPLINNSVLDEDFRNAIYYHYYDFPAFHMVKRHYEVRTHRYKLIHFYDDIDEWELYDLKEDPQEENNIYNLDNYTDIQKHLHLSLDSLQKAYDVTDKEFARTPKEQIDRAYKYFKILSGKSSQ